ncbi:MAG: magnesium-translocating P-type ATPase [Candidatus ainarchaeum sp.]|nr:magnesium-translocating P-type ATPase [Candidatus ainarchaeum sp.]
MANNPPNETNYWAKGSAEVFSLLETSENGLSEEEAKQRLLHNGSNEIPHDNAREVYEIAWAQFKSPLVLILVGAAIIAYFLGDSIDAIVIIAIVLMNAVLGFFQEFKAEKALQALQKFIGTYAKAIRSGELIETESKNLVLGDIVFMEIGDFVPADIRLFKSKNLSIDESSLTGESMPVAKSTEPIITNDFSPQSLHNTVFMGTFVSSGFGYGVVVSTGLNTFFGKTAGLLKQTQAETDFNKNIRKFGNFLLKIVLVMTIFIFIVNALMGKPVFGSLLFAIALAVGITPEALPIIITITLSSASLKMAKEKVVTKTLAAVEDLGNMDVLCCDKTGTLTEGEFALQDYKTIDGKKDSKLLLYALLCNSAKKHGKKIVGNSIDRAIMASKEAETVFPAYKEYRILDENEFDFERRIMSVIAESKNSSVLVAKGAVESILQACTGLVENGKEKKLSPELKSMVLSQAEKFWADGYYVIAVAGKQFAKEKVSEKDESNLVFFGFLLFLDPPKKTVKESLLLFKKLGITIKLLTGDNPVITKKICSEVGIEIVENKIVSGEELEALSSKEFEDYCNKYNVFARITPSQKFRIVSALDREGHVVGVLGDGVNDAPALKAADIGISVDSATGISKEAADIILLKKSLNVLADGIVQGRKTFGNITKYILNTISANFGNMFTVAASSFFLKFIPLLPSQILFNNLVSDAPLLTIATDNVDEEFLKKPKKWDIKLIFDFMVVFGLLSVIFDLALIIPLIVFFNAPEAVFRTAWFILSALSEIIITFAIRSRRPFYKSRPSKLLFVSSIITIIATVGITYTWIGNVLFEFVALPLTILLFIAALLVLYFAAAETAKHFLFKKFEL